MTAPGSGPLLVARGLVHRYRGQEGSRPALDGVDLELAAGECLAVVGESGSGKTTLARCLVRLLEPEARELRFAGEDLRALSRRELRRRRAGFQIVFQDPADAFDPRMSIGDQVGEPLRVLGLAEGAGARRRVGELLAAVHLDPALAGRYPHALSGGERQRAAIARALAPGPRLLVLDEPVSAVDAGLRVQILDLLADLRSRLGLTLLVVTHDLATVGRLADRLAVLFAGRIVERGPAVELLARPRHPYTRELLAAVPIADPARRGRIRGGAPFVDVSAVDAPALDGCRYRLRCIRADRRCALEDPSLRALHSTVDAACHHPFDAAPDGPTGAGAGTEERL